MPFPTKVFIKFFCNVKGEKAGFPLNELILISVLSNT